MMTPEQFFDYFMQELNELPSLYHYYKFHTSAKSFEFRKSYFIQRLKYIDAQVKQYQQTNPNKPIKIWDCGCGYGTTCLYLAMNGIETFGSTLEFYYQYLDKRKEFWNQYGNANLFKASYADIFEEYPENNSIDIVIVQDTLHHLEPMNDAMLIFSNTIKPNGILISIEENGNNIIQNLKLYKQRGNKRIITLWDETLQKKITMGNENIRGIEIWKNIFEKYKFQIDPNSIEFIRYYYPFMYKNNNANYLLEKEKKITSAFLKKYFFFGINFIGINKK